MNRRPYGAGRKGSTEQSRAHWKHRLVTRLPWTLPAASAVGLALFGALFAGAAWLMFGSPWPNAWKLAVVLIQVLSVVTVAVIVAGRGFGKTRQTLATIADVLGFWPIRWHPLAGASYRDEVVDVIRKRVQTSAGKVALVGHSQGSVLAAWSVGGPNAPAAHPGLLLVTCGSPLRSLYGALFPRYFDEQRFARIASGAPAGWVNVWRRTDPIATPLDVDNRVRVDDRVRADPLPDGDGRLRVHGDYWIDDEQIRCVNDHLSPANPQSASD